MRKHLISTLLVLSLSLIFVACGGSEGSGSGGSGNNDSGEPGSIYGIVTDKATGEQIINAGVELQPVGLKTVTGSDGQFEFNEVAAGEYTLYVTKTGYVDQSSSIVVESGKQSKGDVQLEKAPAALRIVDDKGKDISELDFGAEVDDISRSFNIFNDSSASLNWKITWTAEWIITLSEESGELKAGDTLGIIVGIDRTLLREGENLTKLHVTSNNGNKQLTIKATLNKGATRTSECTGLPENAEWNTVSEIEQSWDGEEWQPSAKGSYDEESSKTECRYKCNETFHYENSKCEPNTRTMDCEGLPIGASWNTATSVTQNWNGTEYIPSNQGQYSTTSSASECRFICNTHYTWDGTTCAADSKVVNCEGLPENAKWNTASTITQTWNGEEWAPSATGIYSETASSTECRFQCKPNFFYDHVNSTCLNPCNEDPCSGIEHATSGCVATDWDKFSCECEKTHHWDETKCSEGAICGIDSITPCIDPVTELMWSTKSSEYKTKEEAYTYCYNLDEGGYTDWRVPDIDELRSLLNCSKTGTNGTCEVSAQTGCLSGNYCWSADHCASCGQKTASTVGKFGDQGWVVSSSVVSNDTSYIWLCNFSTGEVRQTFCEDGYGRCKTNELTKGAVRCVRK